MASGCGAVAGGVGGTPDGDGLPVAGKCPPALPLSGAFAAGLRAGFRLASLRAPAKSCVFVLCCVESDGAAAAVLAISAAKLGCETGAVEFIRLELQASCHGAIVFTAYGS